MDMGIEGDDGCNQRNKQKGNGSRDESSRMSGYTVMSEQQLIMIFLPFSFLQTLSSLIPFVCICIC